MKLLITDEDGIVKDVTQMDLFSSNRTIFLAKILLAKANRFDRFPTRNYSTYSRAYKVFHEKTWIFKI